MKSRRDMELAYWGFEPRNDGGPDYGLDFLVTEVEGRKRDGSRDLPPWDLSPPYQRASVDHGPARGVPGPLAGGRARSSRRAQRAVHGRAQPGGNA